MAAAAAEPVLPLVAEEDDGAPVDPRIAALFDTDSAMGDALPASKAQSVSEAAAALPPGLVPAAWQLVVVDDGDGDGSVADAHEVEAGVLWVGAAEPAGSLSFLRAARVRGIVNCAAEVPPPPDALRRRAALLAYEACPLHDDGMVDATPLLRDGAAAVARAVAAVRASGECDAGGGAVLVHCAAGISRSAAVTLAYYVLHRGATLADAAARVRRYRTVAYPNLGFWTALRRLEAAMHGGRSTIPRAALALHRTALARSHAPAVLADDTATPPDAAASTSDCGTT